MRVLALMATVLRGENARRPTRTAAGPCGSHRDAGRVGEEPEYLRQQGGQQFPPEGGFAQAQGGIGEGNASDHEDMEGAGSRTWQRVVNQRHQPA